MLASEVAIVTELRGGLVVWLRGTWARRSTCSVALDGLAKECDMHGAALRLAPMHKAGCTPHGTCYNMLLGACNCTGDAQLAQAWSPQMQVDGAAPQTIRAT